MKFYNPTPYPFISLVKKIALPAIFLTAALVQATVVQRWETTETRLNLVLSLLIILVFVRSNTKHLASIVLFSGILMDILSGLPFGALTLSLLLTALLLDIIVLFLPHRNVLHLIIFAIMGTIAYQVIEYGLTRSVLYLSSADYSLPLVSPALFISALTGILINILLIIFLYPLKNFLAAYSN